MKVPFNDVEPTFSDVECRFSDVERTFNVAERNFLLGKSTFFPNNNQNFPPYFSLFRANILLLTNKSLYFPNIYCIFVGK